LKSVEQSQKSVNQSSVRIISNSFRDCNWKKYFNYS
jgi:hypothetical protein